MLKRKLCEATFDWHLKCEGPLLIKNERYQTYNKEEGRGKKGFPDCLFISHSSEDDLKQIAENCANNPPTQILYYVPGTSIRGPFRAQAEKIIRSILPESAPPWITACDPFEQDEKNHGKTLGCSKRLENEEGKYAAACPACKLFGCAGLASRIKFEDADIAAGYRSVYRDMIGIDRFTGGVFKGGAQGGGANMRFHVLENTSFTTTVTITNFELWQLGLLAYVFRDFQDGLVPIGFGKTKGFGLVKGAINNISLTYTINTFNPEKIGHLGSLMKDDERQYYGVHVYEAPDFTLKGAKEDEFTLYEKINLTGNDIDAFCAKVVPAFNNYMDGFMAVAKEKTNESNS